MAGSAFSLASFLWRLLLFALFLTLNIPFLRCEPRMKSLAFRIQSPSTQTEVEAEVVAAIDLQRERVAEEGATTIVLGGSVSIFVSVLVRRVVRHRGLRSVDLSGDAIALPRRKRRQRLLLSAALSLSRSEYYVNYSHIVCLLIIRYYIAIFSHKFRLPPFNYQQ
jgi:hypothetical protein